MLSKQLKKIYDILYESFGPQDWWPGDTPFEVIIGAILTQNTNWTNVEKAIANLKKANLLCLEKLHKLSPEKLAGMIRPAGYFNIKAKRLKSFLDWFFEEYHGKLKNLEGIPTSPLREELLSVNGIGPETADSILLYALDRPVFVVDAYTVRICLRHHLIDKDADYHRVQEIFESNLTGNVQLFNEYHALLVRLGKDFCKPTPRCEACPLNKLPHSV